jgi:hypothetical protein
VSANKILIHTMAKKAWEIDKIVVLLIFDKDIVPTVHTFSKCLQTEFGYRLDINGSQYRCNSENDYSFGFDYNNRKYYCFIVNSDKQNEAFLEWKRLEIQSAKGDIDRFESYIELRKNLIKRILELDDSI